MRKSFIMQATLIYDEGVLVFSTTAVQSTYMRICHLHDTRRVEKDACQERPRERNSSDTYALSRPKPRKKDHPKSRKEERKLQAGTEGSSKS